MPGTYTYLDYAASAPVRPEALAAERAYDEAPYAGANPNSLHALGRQAARALDESRRVLAQCLGGRFRPSEVLFTSGGTESNNLALTGMAEGARGKDRRRRTIIISAIEHDSVLDVAPLLRGRDFEVRIARADRDGVVRPEFVEALLDDSVALVSLMCANNETGVIQPVAEVARIAHAAGALMHVDAVQGFGRIPLELDDVDAVSLAAHKIGGPVGTGALAIRGRCPFRPQTFGGGQELGKRPGTQDVRSAAGFAAAARVCCDNLDVWRATCAERAQHLYDVLCAEGTRILPTTTATVDEGRLPGVVSVMADGVDSETLVMACDAAGFEVSAGSACSSGSLDASHVLRAMNIPDKLALGALRISFDERVGTPELDAFAQALLTIVQRETTR